MTRNIRSTNSSHGAWLIGRRAMRRSVAGFVVTICLAAHGQQQRLASAQSPPKGADTTVGVEGRYYARAGSALQPQGFEENSPILLRIADVTRDGDVFLHDIRYIAYYPGQYDLRDWLMQADGSAPADMTPAEVVIGSVLPQDHNGQLAELARPPSPWVWPYRAFLMLVAVVWTLPLAWVVGRRLFRRKPPTIERAAPRPTLADQLAPLVAAILNNRGDAHQQAELERLLLAHWRQRLDLEECSAAESIAKMRGDSQAGALLRQFEAWLYLPPGEAEVDVPALLAPYRHAETIELSKRAPCVAEVVA